MRIIGIAGPSGAGKTTLSHYLASSFKDEFCHVRQDDYLKDPSEFPMKGKFRNWETPSNYMFDVLARHLLNLRQGRSLAHRTFDQDGSMRLDYEIEPKDCVLLEGSLILTDERIRGMVDLKIYLDIPPDLMVSRRAERARTMGWDFDLTEYDREVTIPEFQRHGRIQKFYADYIIDATRTKRQVAGQVKKLVKSEIKINENKSANSTHVRRIWDQGYGPKHISGRKSVP
jgi:uridine kinase